uniref:Uncharacterized protein n=1 Tax=Strombidium inclinatum TaxID=197538 RepID=A0A7S3IKE1_9SPIT|mmetsp:Transcript_24590/g.38177  ORF Transcript_24590/g.38177 Transcript_24590/m.38177 type:complete len:197 (+) Transcript_24590:2199-2789(+)
MEQDVKVWDTETGINCASLQGHESDIYSIKSSTDGSYAVSVGKDRTIKIWDIRCKSFIGEMDGSGYKEMNEIALTPSGSEEVEGAGQTEGMATVGHQDGSVTMWSMRQRQVISHNRLHDGEVRGVSYMANGRYLASAGFDNKVVISDTSDVSNLQVVKTLEHDDKVVSVRWHPCLPILLSTSADKSARIWSPQDEK